jgi:HAD superfamily phosphoserine phosphatase-like hydrolase
MGYLLRHPWRLPRLLGALPGCMRFFLGRSDPGAVKASFIHATLGGIPRAQLQDWTRRYLEGVLKHALHSDALRRLEQHRARGDYLVLLSASTDLYVPQLAGALGFAEAICTGLEWREDVLVGYLSTPNRRGEEKVRCVERLRAQHPRRLLAAYGNAGSDIAHLRMAERPVLVNGSRAARKAAKRYGIPQETWH